jgi:hypothetical protein
MSAYQLRTDLECLNCDHFEDESGGFAFGKCRPTGLLVLTTRNVPMECPRRSEPPTCAVCDTLIEESDSASWAAWGPVCSHCVSELGVDVSEPFPAHLFQPFPAHLSPNDATQSGPQVVSAESARQSLK